ANFGTPPDGFAPRMQMFIWTGASPATLRVNEPAATAGDYNARSANWGEPLSDPGTIGTLELVNASSGTPNQGCSALTGFNAGNIALIRRGGCEFGTKALLAENAGASAVVIINNEGGNGTINMGAGADGNSVTVPVAMIGNDDGDLIVADLGNTISGQLFQEGSANLNRDSDLDAGVIAHEYGHGLSNRLTGGPSQASCLSGAQQGGEGWSDFLGLWTTAKASDTSDQPRGMGSYLIFQEGVPGAGIRPAPYIRDLNLNPLTYDNIRGAGQAGGVSIPHGVGTVLNSAMWDMYWNLVDKHGFDEDFYTGTGGNNLALQLVVDGLKLQPCSPSFLDFRDAVLLADQINDGGANQCEIWDAFARRGMGINSSDGGSASSQNVTADDTLPLQCQGELPIFQDRFEDQ
ncbi:MAG: M36 family metallopeptidase, partial [Pseudomonadota bacterium]